MQMALRLTAVTALPNRWNPKSLTGRAFGPMSPTGFHSFPPSSHKLSLILAPSRRDSNGKSAAIPSNKPDKESSSVQNRMREESKVRCQRAS